jgi:hypothetical protein
VLTARQLCAIGTRSSKQTRTKLSRSNCSWAVLDEVKGISLLLYLLMVRMELKLTEQRQEPLSLIDSFNCCAAAASCRRGAGKVLTRRIHWTPQPQRSA